MDPQGAPPDPLIFRSHSFGSFLCPSGLGRLAYHCVLISLVVRPKVAQSLLKKNLWASSAREIPDASTNSLV